MVPLAGVRSCWGGGSATPGGAEGRAGDSGYAGMSCGLRLVAVKAPAWPTHLRAGSSFSTVGEEVPHLDPVESLFYHQFLCLFPSPF